MSFSLHWQRRSEAQFWHVAFWSWFYCARLHAENINIPVSTPKWSPCLIFAGACHDQKTGIITKTCDKICDKYTSSSLHWISVVIGFAIFCSQRWILGLHFAVKSWGSISEVQYVIFSGPFKCNVICLWTQHWIALAFGMLTVGSIFHWLYFDCICWLVLVAIDRSVFIWTNVAWIQWKGTLKARSIRVSLNQGMA